MEKSQQPGSLARVAIGGACTVWYYDTAFEGMEGQVSGLCFK